MDDSLTSFIEEVCGESHLRVEDDLGDGFVRLRSAEAERRQAQHDIRCVEDIVIEMLRNARDAHARTVFIALSKQENTRRICMIDDGDGVPEALREAIFEPRVTSKLDTVHVDKWGVHGRGMALFSIKSNTEEARVAESSPGLGSSFVVVSRGEKIPEKTDQSSMPEIYVDDKGEIVLRGPRNINRTIVEFVLECKDLTVYLGSQTDIAATLYAYGEATLSKSMRVFQENRDELPLVKRLSTTSEPALFANQAKSLGLLLSERTARRILDREIAVLSPLDEIISIKKEDAGTRNKRGKTRSSHKDLRGLKLNEDDISSFKEKIDEAFASLAECYYLEQTDKAELRFSSDMLHIKIPFNKIH